MSASHDEEIEGNKQDPSPEKHKGRKKRTSKGSKKAVVELKEHGSAKKRKKGSNQHLERPKAPRNTSQDIINKKLQLSTQSPTEHLHRVLSMTNFSNAYGSNAPFQDIFDGGAAGEGAVADAILSPSDVFDMDEGSGDHSQVLIKILTTKLRELNEENKALRKENDELRRGQVKEPAN